MDNDLITKEEEKEVLLAMAVILKRNCEKYSECVGCPLYGTHRQYISYSCPIATGANPSDWDID